MPNTIEHAGSQIHRPPSEGGSVLCAHGTAIEIVNATDPDARKGQRFRGIAHSGKPVPTQFGKRRILVVVDLEGGQYRLPVPALYQHGFEESSKRRVGAVELANPTDEGLYIEGFFLKNNKHAQEIRQDGEDGYPWEYSIYADPDEVEIVPEGQEAFVNGQTVQGPAEILRAWRLGEVSFCERGRDAHTSSEIFTRGPAAKETTMAKTTTPGGKTTTTTTQFAEGGETGEDTQMVNLAALTVEEIEEKAPELAAAFKKKYAESEKDPEPAPEAMSRILERYSAIEHATPDRIVQALEYGMNEATAAKFFARQAALVTPSQEPPQAPAPKAPASDDGDRQRAARRAVALSGSAADPIDDANRPASLGGAAVFSGAAGNDPAADWKNSRELREHWSEDREAFMRFARMQQRDGDDYLIFIHD